MSVITWSEFPQIKAKEDEQRMALVVSEMFLPPTYATLKEKYGHIARKLTNIAVLTGAFFLVTEIDALAANNESLDSKAKELYGKLVGIAKWIIAGKGGWSTIHKMLQEDFEGAKKSFLQYLIIFIIVIAFPKALDYIEVFFE